ncbi:vesicle transport through interaction with t-SNAREs homolog 1B-like [Uloborus diversus]|uniref:vesicle transport through interaction with t-SNAREs homolog 1B-like n=1 Tax=Uloborus diversus TaxID=327109 RepID=UPI0024090C2F|nr:vesicle transport through interaction with t-SNAREs homolog 1B-like [Uloborus diversus]
MSSENFESLEDDFVALKDGLVSKIDDLNRKSSNQAKKNVQREIERELEDAQRLLEDLDGEARSAPYPFRMQMNSRIKTYRQDLNAIKKKIQQSESSSQRSQLLGNPSQPGTGPLSSSTLGNRGRLLQMNETVNRTTESVHRAQRVAAETDEVAVAVVDELGTQREALIRTKERLVDTDSNLVKSRKILRSMYRRVMTNKLILIVIIILELAILAGVVYYKFFRK